MTSTAARASLVVVVGFTALGSACVFSSNGAGVGGGGGSSSSSSTSASSTCP